VTGKIETWHCPRCGTQLPAAGSVECDGVEMPVFQCDRCVVEQEFLGERMQMALTFVVTAAGQAVDPADGRLLS
jgi:hypothetical protein